MSDKTTTAYWHGGAPGLKPGDNRKLHERRLRLAEDLLMRRMLIDHDGAVVA